MRIPLSGDGTWVLTAFLLASTPLYSVSESDKKRIMKDLSSEEPDKQMQARQELKSYGFREVADALEDYFRDPDPQMRILTVQMLGDLGGIESWKILKKLYRKEKEGSVRRAILIRLSGILPDDIGSVDFFCRAALKDHDPDTRLIALNQASLFTRNDVVNDELKSVSWKVLRKDNARANRVLASIILREFGEKSRKISEFVLEGLKSTTAEVRRRAALVVRSAKGPEAIQILQNAAQDPDSEVRANLCKSLGEIKEKATIPILGILAQDQDPQVRRNSVSALSSFSEEDVTLNPFFSALKDRDPSIRLVAVGALERYGDPAALTVLEKTSQEDPDTSVRTLAKKALVTLGTAKQK